MSDSPMTGVVDWLSRLALPSRREAVRPAARARSRADVTSFTHTTRHIFSVDVEEYFHALALASCAPRDRWSSLPSRVESNTGILLDLLDRNETKGTFFVVG